MAEIDRLTISDGLPGRVLMETAGRAVAREAAWFGARRILVLCGPGNNGGDGYVAARHLHQHGFEVRLTRFGAEPQGQDDAARNWELLAPLCLPCDDWSSLDLSEVDLVIDALFGTGLTRPLQGELAQGVDRLNRSGLPVLSVDIPSGVDSATGQVLGAAVAATRTVTFGLPKFGLLIGAGAALSGQVVVEEIGFSRRRLEGGAWRIGPDWVSNRLPQRPLDAHKGTCGRALVVAGSERYPGAAGMSALGALRGGAGLVTVAVPQVVKGWLESALLEAMFMPRTAEMPLHADALCLGPGLDESDEASALCEYVLDSFYGPMVIDADGLRYVAGKSHERHVLTPHPGEMARLLDCSTAEVQSDRVAAAREAARQTGAVVVLKGGPTLVAFADELYLNSSGGPFLAQGGSGDVLAGLITALLAQGCRTLEAAVMGVYLHGRAGELAATSLGPRGVPASAVAESIPLVYGELLA
ncbi:MAG: NAD(P)H-hydrate dehydratase [Candidatus Eremiobacteraeota bacterium]|nr:NAD(P)H-hydrate dehydratase [Candidatus Eremiobacteraeota bacterium]